MNRAPIVDPTALTATQATQAIRTGEISSQDLVRACIGRIAELDSDVQAWEHFDPEYALAQARAADAAIAAGEAIGPLHGVPVGVKDIFDTADLPTENGCPIFAGQRPTSDAPSVAALRDAGAVILGKTVTTELALLTPARTRNPRNLAHTPGGSSAGSAAAVAAHMVPVTLGSQTAGSIIRPASFCGIVGFKPTLGLVPRGGVLMQSHTLDTVGMYGRSVEDVALLTDCMAAYEPDDPTSIRRARPDIAAFASSAPPVPPRLAFVRTPAWNDADPEMRSAFEQLAAQLGDRAVDIDIPVLPEVIEHQRIVQLAENAHYYGPLLDRAPQHISAGLTQRLKEGRAINGQTYLAAIVRRDPTYNAVRDAIDGFDAILTPAALGPAPEGLGATGSPIFNGLWTYLGMPAVSVPLLTVRGLPVGVQLVGRRNDDARLLRTAAWLVKKNAG